MQIAATQIPTETIRPTFHVVPNGRMWAVELEGQTPVHILDVRTKAEALGFAITQARQAAGFLTIHKGNGQIQENRNYLSEGPDQIMASAELIHQA